MRESVNRLAGCGGAPAAGDEVDHVGQEQAESADLVRLIRDRAPIVEERSPCGSSTRTLGLS